MTTIKHANMLRTISKQTRLVRLHVIPVISTDKVRQLLVPSRANSSSGAVLEGC